MNLCFCPYRACFIAAPSPGCCPGLRAFALAGRGLEHRGTEPRRVYFKLSEDTESLYFKFSEDTENSKTPWLCDSVFINFAEGGSPLISQPWVPHLE